MSDVKLYALGDDERSDVVESLRAFASQIEHAGYDTGRNDYDVRSLQLLADRIESGHDATVERGWSRACPTCGTRVEASSRTCEHDWQEQPGEPPRDVCPLCGESRE